MALLVHVDDLLLTRTNETLLARARGFLDRAFLVKDGIL